jgi:hypothetical protein
MEMSIGYRHYHIIIIIIIIVIVIIVIISHLLPKVSPIRLVNEHVQGLQILLAVEITFFIQSGSKVFIFKQIETK